MILDFPPKIERVISDVAISQGLSLEQFVIMGAYEKALQIQAMPQQSSDMLLTDFAAQMPKLAIFQDIDPVAYQRELRDEWD